MPLVSYDKHSNHNRKQQRTAGGNREEARGDTEMKVKEVMPSTFTPARPLKSTDNPTALRKVSLDATPITSEKNDAPAVPLLELSATAACPTLTMKSC